jgi:hypothetical protein
MQIKRLQALVAEYDAAVGIWQRAEELVMSIVSPGMGNGQI